MRKCGKEVTIWLVCFLFFSFFCMCSMSVSFLSHTSSCERGCSCEMMKFQGKVDVPSITGGGKVQINHLISPAFSLLSWGSRARGKSINLHKWDMTQRSLCLYTGLCTYLTLALSLYNNSDQLPSRLGWTSLYKMQKHPVEIPNSHNSCLLVQRIGENFIYVRSTVTIVDVSF